MCCQIPKPFQVPAQGTVFPYIVVKTNSEDIGWWRPKWPRSTVLHHGKMRCGRLDRMDGRGRPVMRAESHREIIVQHHRGGQRISGQSASGAAIRHGRRREIHSKDRSVFEMHYDVRAKRRCRQARTRAAKKAPDLHFTPARVAEPGVSAVMAAKS